MEPAYHVTRVCHNLQTEGEDEDNIVDGTIHNQGPEKWHRTDMLPAPIYFADDHSQKDCLIEVTTSETSSEITTGRTSITRADVQAKNPFGCSCPHPVKPSGASQSLESHLPNTETLPSCANGIPDCITPICASDFIHYGT